MEEDNQPHERGGTEPFPDIMNDPAYATNSDAKFRGLEEPDTCRICRGEGSEEEPLFYPCKCSGSIKFVHQACLMEWLSHSQKKYCELCKTPFRFTKLYDPNMPQELPAPVFLKELVLHGGRTLVTWLRFLLVAFVWLGWLPWSMRAIWRALFWLADGHWPNSETLQRQALQNEGNTLSQLAANSTIRAEQTLISSASGVSTAVQGTSSASPSLLSPVSSMLNFSAGEPFILSLAKRAFIGLFPPAISSSGSSFNSSDVNVTVSSHRQRQPSWLSDVTFLNSLTPSPTFNNILIDTLEGQLITLLVVISFILVFLIREWVVQQQPAVNIAEGEREAAVQLIAENRLNQGARIPPQQEPLLQVEDENNIEQHDHDESDEEPHVPDATETGSSGPNSFQNDNGAHGEASSSFDEGTMRFGNLPLETYTSRPIIQSRNAMDDASSIHRTLEETAATPGNQVWPGLEIFKDLWTRGGGNPDEVLRIIEEENRQDELGWIVSAMTRLQRSNTEHSPFDEGTETLGPNLGRADAFGSSLQDRVHQGGSDTVDADIPGPTNDVPFWSSRQDAVPSSSLLAREADVLAPESNFRFSSRTSSVSSSIMNRDTSGVLGGEIPFEIEDMGEGRSPGAPGEPAQQQRETSNDGAANNATNNRETEIPANRVSGDAVSQPTTADTPAHPPRNLSEKITDWLWGDVAPSDQAQEHDRNDVHVEDIAGEGPFVHAANRDNAAQQDLQGQNQWQDQVVDAGLEQNDVDAVEDGDELEGIMELIGMQGPIFGLLQNGVFSAVLISLTVAIGIWLPYLWGKIALVFLTNPIQLFIGVPLALLSIIADVTVDTLIGSFGYLVYWISIVLRGLLGPVGNMVPLVEWVPRNTSVTSASLSLIDGSSQRLKRVVDGFFTFHESDLPMFSVLSHQALRIHEARIVGFFETIFLAGKFIMYDFPLRVMSQGLHQALVSEFPTVDLSSMLANIQQIPNTLGTFDLFSLSGLKWVNLRVPGSGPVQGPVDYDLARWDTKDRTVAIIVGYGFATALGLLYLRLTGLFSGVNRGQRIEGVIADILHQAGGVMKVILIIGIEMIVFPLYCGTLLDVALMPLFENASLKSRLEFTSASPVTSLFVHWFIGTCYMFHFALFVSMCRKIMRSGVLYFIRDPDDPTFHPVRDVLERNISTQLRKIAFSALVYGALVIVCLGGVVWGLSYSCAGVLPIHWSSNVPFLEFPVDLLFYNFVMPFAIRSVKPSDGLHTMYNWWFHQCARMLRLTNFLFGGERRPDEEGRHVRRSWRAVLLGKKGDPKNPVIGEDQKALVEEKGVDAYFLRNGRFVRAPGSDQVRIPKGAQVFLEVTEDNKRKDGAADPDDGLHGRTSDMFTQVYIPPFFRLRVAFFLFLIWVFAAVTGVSITIVPLVTGRKLISTFFPSPVRVNDIYAFSVGLYVVGGAVYGLIYCRSGVSLLKERLHPYLNSPQQAARAVYETLLYATKLIYLASAFALLLPSLFALVTELYILVPLHTYLEDDQAHVIHFIQDWTLGVLYVQMALRFTLWHSSSRPAIALNAVSRGGWRQPQVGLATRALILPISVLTFLAVTVPLVLGFIVNRIFFYSAASDLQSKVYRYAYPTTLLVGLLVWSFYLLRRQIEAWRVHIRDDVYLIGERLHNFGEKRARDVGVPRRMIT
ncbi:hypothetical protein DTO166G4_6100 [Paecilomyces variotii]|nr:hypothetical protein DTO166G4_6100 [Paecilomyces variotii]KAJ9235332.1 hypothetical protein DTO166G5_4613 [Paecilomyces variotii]KAJ9253532.1 hypothetical protein DTO195F2_6983 [Paecilomyces variotii]KAJ9369902.1 hypothetical protein DTO282E5_5410 [Paecilomyces variotii]